MPLKYAMGRRTVVFVNVAQKKRRDRMTIDVHKCRYRRGTQGFICSIGLLYLVRMSWPGFAMRINDKKDEQD